MLSSSTHHDTRPNSSWKKFRRKTFLLQPFFSFGAGHIFLHLTFCVFFALPTLMNTYIWKKLSLFAIDTTTILQIFFSFVKNKTATIYFSSFWMCTVFLYTLSCNTLKYRVNLWFFRRIKISNYTHSNYQWIFFMY